ncbi:alpha-hydroxy-acid oxidizing protein, partial [Phocaeicola vulgatus]
PGAKGSGDTAIRNYQKWQEIRVNMDTLCENLPADTSLELFGKTFRYPFFAGPAGAVNLHYSEKYTDVTYNEVLVSS